MHYKQFVLVLFIVSLGLLFFVGIVSAVDINLPCDFYGYQGDDSTLAVGDVIIAKDPDGIICGSFIVAVDGQYGFLTCRKDNHSTLNIDEGAIDGDVITFFLNGKESINKAVWIEGEIVRADINIEQNIEQISIDLQPGYNPVGFSVIPQNLPSPYKASQFLNDLNNVGLDISMVMQWDGDDFVSYDSDLLFTDYDLNLDEGIFLYVKSNGMWIFTGKEIPLPKSVKLNTGWNFIIVPTTVNASTAKQLAEQINSGGGMVEKIMWWDKGGWVLYLVGEDSTDYDLVKGRGYFVLCGDRSIWEMQ